MGIEKRKILVGDYVKICEKNKKISQGMVRSILRDFQGKTIVQLFTGETGEVIRLFSKRPISIKKRLVITNESKIIKTNELAEKELFSGERKDIEYKLSALWSQDLNKNELEQSKSPEIKKYGNRASKIIIAKVIAGFMNSSGGDLIIGIKENKNQELSNAVVGIESEFFQLKNKDFGEDGYRRMIMDDVIRSYFPMNIFNHFNNYFYITFPKKEGKTLCRINVKKSESEVFIRIANEDYFFIRVDTQTRELRGKEVVDYIRRHFK